jgi:hypothetical protein
MSSFCTIRKSSVSTGCTEQIMPVLHILYYNGSLIASTVVGLTIAKFKPHIFYVCLHVALLREHIHPHDFV